MRRCCLLTYKIKQGQPHSRLLGSLVLILSDKNQVFTSLHYEI